MAKRRVPSTPLPRVAIVCSQYNRSITHAMRDAAVREYARRGGRGAAIVHVAAPGSFELPFLAMAAASSGLVEGVVAIGCIIKGETSHDRVIADAVANGLTSVGLTTGVPVSLGVLTVDSVEQAVARSGGRGGDDGTNKGREAMAALLDTLDSARGIGRGGSGRRARASIPDKAARRRAGRGG